MTGSFEFVPSRFLESLQEIRQKFPLIREVIYTDKSRETEDFIREISDLHPDQLISFAARIKNHDLDLPLMAFRAHVGDQVSDKMDTILKTRFRKKIFLLNWLILQNNYRNERLIASMGNLCDLMKERFPEEYAETIFFKIGSWGENPIRQVMELFREEQTTVKRFFEKYSFLEKSKFSYDFCTAYFHQASREVFTADWEVFIQAASSYVPEQSAWVLDRYLSAFEAVEYPEKVTDLILKLHGRPEEGKEFWELLGEESRKRFAQWTTYQALARHFGKGSKKHSFWAHYLKNLVKVEIHEKQDLCFLYFDSCVVVDLGETSQTAYLYYQETFLLEYEYFSHLPDTNEKCWRIFPEQVVDARSSVIEGKRSDIYLFSYELVGRLYIKEILKTEALQEK